VIVIEHGAQAAASGKRWWGLAMTTRARGSTIVNAKDRTAEPNSGQRGAALAGGRTF
jgi:hypothetical protein